MAAAVNEGSGPSGERDPKYSLTPVIVRAKEGDVGAAYALLEHASDWLRARRVLPPELANYLIEAFERITGEASSTGGWGLLSPLTYSNVEELLKDQWPGEDCRDALNLRQRQGRRPKLDYIRRAQRFLLASDLSTELLRLKGEWEALKQQKLGEVDLPPDSAKAKRYIRRWRVSWRRQQLGGLTERAWTKKQVASRHNVSLREVEAAWADYGAGPRSYKLSEHPLGEAEMVIVGFLRRQNP